MSKSDTGWKEALLKSGLPLEHNVAKIAASKKILCEGEFLYRKEDEAGRFKDFSVDFAGWELRGNWAFVKHLIECKYCHPGKKWVFAPSRDNAIITGGIGVYDHLSTEIILDKHAIHEFDLNFEFCSNGVEIDGNSSRSDTIREAVMQIKYAIPPRVSDIVDFQLLSNHDEDLFIGFSVSVIVTTAEIHLLRYGADLKSILNANNLTQIADKQNAIIYYSQAHSHLKNHINAEIKKNI